MDERETSYVEKEEGGGETVSGCKTKKVIDRSHISIHCGS